jgi:hypothetical protein
MRHPNLITLVFLLTTTAAFAADKTPVAAKKKKLTIQDLLTQAGGSSKPATAVAGVRGLEETSGDVDTKARDFAAVDRLDGLVIHDNEVTAFVDEGKLK